MLYIDKDRFSGDFMGYQELMQKIERHHPQTVIGVIYNVLDRMAETFQRERDPEDPKSTEILILLYTSMGNLGVLSNALAEFMAEKPEIKMVIN